MTDIRADIEIEIGGGLYGGGSSGLGGAFKAKSVQIQFTDKFCTKHNVKFSSYYGNNSTICKECEKETRAVVRDLLMASPWDHSYMPAYEGETDSAYVDCANIRHSHECGCHLGHECGPGCASHVSADSHPLEQLAAEAPNKELSGVYTRLEYLEEQNKALRELLTQVLAHLPENEMNSIVPATLREKIGVGAVDGTVGGATDV